MAFRHARTAAFCATKPRWVQRQRQLQPPETLCCSKGISTSGLQDAAVDSPGWVFLNGSVAMRQERPTRLTKRCIGRGHAVAVAHRGILSMLVCAVPALYEEHLARRRSLRSGRHA